MKKTNLTPLLIFSCLMSTAPMQGLKITPREIEYDLNVTKLAIGLASAIAAGVQGLNVTQVLYGALRQTEMSKLYNDYPNVVYCMIPTTISTALTAHHYLSDGIKRTNVCEKQEEKQPSKLAQPVTQ